MSAFIITATTTDQEIEVIPYQDMLKEARERRDDAAAVLDVQGDQEVLEYVEYSDGVAVLFSPVFGYALVNRWSAGVGDSMVIENGGAASAEDAADQWRDANVA